MTLPGPETWNPSSLTITTNAVNGTTFNVQTLSGVITGAGTLIKSWPRHPCPERRQRGHSEPHGRQCHPDQWRHVADHRSGDAAFGMVPGDSATANNIDIDGGVLNFRVRPLSC